MKSIIDLIPDSTNLKISNGDFVKIYDFNITNLIGFKYVKYLKLTYCDIDSLEGLYNYDELEIVSFIASKFNLNNIDLISEQLGKCTNLKKIHFDNVNLLDLDILKKSLCLKELNLIGNNLLNIDVVKSLINL